MVWPIFSVHCFCLCMYICQRRLVTIIAGDIDSIRELYLAVPAESAFHLSNSFLSSTMQASILAVTYTVRYWLLIPYYTLLGVILNYLNNSSNFKIA